MTRLTLLSIFFFAILFISCDKNNDCVSIQTDGICIDPNLIGNGEECIEIYDPVCGCDGVTYSNYCVADSAGITSYVAGECCD